MKKEMCALVLISFVFVIFAGQAWAGAFSSTEYGFSVQMPKMWINQVEKEIKTVYLLGPNGEQVSISMKNEKDKVDLEKAYKDKLESLKSTYSEMNEINSGDVMIGGQSAKFVIYEHKLDNRELKSISYVVANGYKLCEINCHVGAENFEKSRTDFDSIINSFKFK